MVPLNEDLLQSETLAGLKEKDTLNCIPITIVYYGFLEIL